LSRRGSGRCDIELCVPAVIEKEQNNRKICQKVLVVKRSTRFFVFSCLFLLIISAIIGALGIKIARRAAANAAASATQSASLSATALIGGSVTPVPTLGYTAHTFKNSLGQTLRYYLYLPLNYNPQKRYPLVLFLHGGGERERAGYTAIQDQNLVLHVSSIRVWSAEYPGVPNPQIQEKWPCFVLVPQLGINQNWVNVNFYDGPYHQPEQPSSGLELTKELLDSLQKKDQSIDPQRLYITGYSNGGAGTWDAIARWPNYFAAAAPIAGAGDPTKVTAFKNLAIWAFHGDKDATVAVSGTRDMITALKSVGGNPRYTEFAGMGHGGWGMVYGVDQPVVADFLPWLFAQHRSE
jgi:predicted peptidase